MTRVREAATLMLLDDRPDLHVFMLRRNPRSVFGPGAFVFPGGAVDPGDREPGLTGAVVGLDDRRASVLLDRPAGGLGVWVAALREAFEEAGILLACDLDGGAPSVDADALERTRNRLNAGEIDFAAALAHHDLRLDTREVCVFSHWLTPEGAPRRYDTWFLAAPAPHGQEGSHDDAELVHSEWVRPTDALARAAAGELDLILPTLRTLRVLSTFTRTNDALDALRTASAATDRAPLVVADGSGQRVALDTDDRERAVPGWARLSSRPALDLAALLTEHEGVA